MIGGRAVVVVVWAIILATITVPLLARDIEFVIAWWRSIL